MSAISISRVFKGELIALTMWLFKRMMAMSPKIIKLRMRLIVLELICITRGAI